MTDREIDEMLGDFGKIAITIFSVSIFLTFILTIAWWFWEVLCG